MAFDVNGDVPEWFAEKEMCDFGCQSRVRSLRGKGWARRVLMWGIISKALGTAREPF